MPAIIEILPVRESIATVEEYLEFLEGLEAATLDGEAILEAEAVAVETAALFEVIEGVFIAAIIVILAIAILTGTDDDTETELETVKKTRRRKKTALCSRECLEIIHSARDGVRTGQYLKTGMPTEDNVERFTRKFKSRA